MYTDHEIGLDEHLTWIKRLEFDFRQIVFIVFVEEVVIGVISINQLDRLNKKADWAFYLDEKSPPGLGAALEYAFINFSFDFLGLEKLNCEVIESNQSVIKLHKKFRFFEEGFRRMNIEKNGCRLGVYFLGLTKEEWNNKKVSIFETYNNTFSRYNIIFDGA
jgi:UDP-4-amino-4,6-dideoxy-N-acetyl-beta-L-altrosamine N-acetyltransferase